MYLPRECVRIDICKYRQTGICRETIMCVCIYVSVCVSVYMYLPYECMGIDICMYRQMGICRKTIVCECIYVSV